MDWGTNKGPWGQQVHKLEAGSSFKRTQILVQLAQDFTALTPSVKRPLVIYTNLDAPIFTKIETFLFCFVLSFFIITFVDRRLTGKRQSTCDS
jgi:hypothetical protein